MRNSIKILLLLLSLCDHWSSYCQDKSGEFTALEKRAEFLYRTKQYREAAAVYSQAVRLNGITPQIENWVQAARCWTLAGNLDSGFYYLEPVSSIPGLTYKQVSDYVLTDEELTGLQGDERWKEMMNRMFLKAYNSFSSRQSKLIGDEADKVINNTLNPISLGLNIDTAFLHLNDPAVYCLRQKNYKKAYALYKLSIDHFPPNPVLYKNLCHYYTVTGDIDKAFVYFTRKEALLYHRYLDTCSDCLLTIDSAFLADYYQYSKTTGRTFWPPLPVLSTIAIRLLSAGKIENAQRLFKLNAALYPDNFLVYKDFASFYFKIGDTLAANQHFIKGYTLQYRLPPGFFDPSFDLPKFFKERQITAERQKGKMPFYSEPFFLTLATFFLNNKMYKKAEFLFQSAIETYPKSVNTYTGMSSFYKAVGDTVRGKIYLEKAEAIKLFYKKAGITGTDILPDTLFDVTVKNPVCHSYCPVVMIHDNGKWKGGLERSFASLVANDGYQIRVSRAALTNELLAGINVLVLACDRLSEEEVHNLNTWIVNGGSVLAMTHHDQLEFDNYLNTLGIQTGEVVVVEDSLNGLERDGVSANPVYIVFSKKNGLIGNHSIMNGKNTTEQIHTVKSFGGGKPIIGPPGSSVLLRLDKSAVDFMSVDPYLRSRVPIKTKAGESFGVAFEMGKGKVVVLGSSFIITAELFPPDWGKVGMNNPNSDNKQFALNIIHWLTGYLK